MKNLLTLSLFLTLTTSMTFAQGTVAPTQDQLIKSDVENSRKFELEQKQKATMDQQAEEKRMIEEKAANQEKMLQEQKDPAYQRKAMEEYMTPGEMQKMLAELAGEWNQKVLFWTSPSVAPTVETSKCTISMIMGGRFQKSVTTGKMKDMPFEGLGIIGCDNASKRFQSTWIGNYGTGIMYLQGVFDKKNNTIVLKGTTIDPITKKELATRESIKIIDKSQMIMDLFIVKDGVESKTMQIVSTRALKTKAGKK